MMLFVLSLFAFVELCWGSSNPDVSNYFVDTYEENTGEYTVYYPYPMNLCLQTGAYSYDWAIYTCSADGTEVTKETFNSSTCTHSTGTETFDESDTHDNGIYDFNCGGMDNYATVEVCLGFGQDIDSSAGEEYDCASSTCVLYGTASFATGICHYAGNGTTSERLATSCDGDGATATYYPDADDTCMIAANSFSAGLVCDYFGRINTEFGKVYVYAYMIDCVSDGVNLTPKEEPTEQPTEQPDSESPDSSDSIETTDSDNSGGGGATGSQNASGTVNDTTAVIAIIAVIAILAIIVGVSYYLHKRKQKAVNYENERRSSGIGMIGADDLATGGAAQTNGQFDDISHDRMPRNTNDELVEAEPSVDDVGLGNVATNVTTGGGQFDDLEAGGGEDYEKDAQALPENANTTTQGNDEDDFSDDNSDKEVMYNVTTKGPAVPEGAGDVPRPDETNDGVSGEQH